MPGTGHQEANRQSDKPLLVLLLRLPGAAGLVLPALGVHAGVVLTTLHSFQVLTNVANPKAGLVRGGDG